MFFIGHLYTSTRQTVTSLGWFTMIIFSAILHGASGQNPGELFRLFDANQVDHPGAAATTGVDRWWFGDCNHSDRAMISHHSYLDRTVKRFSQSDFTAAGRVTREIGMTTNTLPRWQTPQRHRSLGGVGGLLFDRLPKRCEDQFRTVEPRGGQIHPDALLDVLGVPLGDLRNRGTDHCLG